MWIRCYHSFRLRILDQRQRCWTLLEEILQKSILLVYPGGKKKTPVLPTIQSSKVFLWIFVCWRSRDPGINKMPALKLTNIEQRCTFFVSNMSSSKIIWSKYEKTTIIWGNYEKNTYTNHPICQPKSFIFCGIFCPERWNSKDSTTNLITTVPGRFWAMGFVDKHWLFWRVLVENMSMWMILQGDEFSISSNKISIDVYTITNYVFGILQRDRT